MYSKTTVLRFLFLGISLLLISSEFTLLAQVPVHEEPRHRPVFENKEIRILNVLIPPGDTTLYHIHTTPSVFITFTNTATGFQIKGEGKINSDSEAGAILVEDLSGDYIRTHRVWNRDNSAFNVMDVELLYKDSELEENPLDLPDLTLEIDTTWVRVYRLDLPAGKNFQLEDPQQALLLVALQNASLESESNGKSTSQEFNSGGFLNIPKKKSFSITNSGRDTAKLVLLEFPKRFSPSKMN